jgi:hypothetical protein
MHAGQIVEARSADRLHDDRHNMSIAQSTTL